jgi:hypothetical protein
MESDQYANPILESKIDNLTGLVRWHEEDMKKWREQHINRHSGIFFGIGFGVIIVVLIALGVSGFHAIKNVEKATIGKIDKLQSLVSDTTVDNGAGRYFKNSLPKRGQIWKRDWLSLRRIIKT